MHKRYVKNVRRFIPVTLTVWLFFQFSRVLRPLILHADALWYWLLSRSTMRSWRISGSFLFSFQSHLLQPLMETNPNSGALFMRFLYFILVFIILIWLLQNQWSRVHLSDSPGLRTRVKSHSRTMTMHSWSTTWSWLFCFVLMTAKPNDPSNCWLKFGPFSSRLFVLGV